MYVAAPLWLALLLPWLAVAVWLLWTRRGERTDVPFLSLWRGAGDESPRAQNAFRPPPVVVVALLGAALLAIVASARPGLSTSPSAAGSPVTIILDRGLTMSVGERRREVVDAANTALSGFIDAAVVTFVSIPDGVADESDRSGWSARAMALPPTQERTRDSIRFAVRQALAKADAPVIVLSDHPLDVENARIVQIAPAKRLENAGITRLAIRESAGGAQAMVTVSNASAQTRAVLRLRSGEQRVSERAIDLPKRGGEANVFIDLPTLDGSVAAELDVAGDEIPIDNIASARRRHAFPAIEIRATVPPEVRRVAEAYARSRPPIEASPHVAVTTDDRVPGDMPVAMVASSAISRGGGAVTVAAHPVTAGIDWEAAKAAASGEPPGADWRPIVSINEKPAVAIKESSRRQVWVGLDAPDFARTPDFVIFWTNVFDWLAGREGPGRDGPAEWASNIVAPIDVTAATTTVDWQARLRQLKPQKPAGTDLTSAVLLLCVMCLILAACAWPGRRLTAFSTPRTV